MTAIAIFALEGVLQAEGGRPVEAGCHLYHALAGTLRYQIGVLAACDETIARRFFDHQHMPVPAFIRWEIPATAYEWMTACRAIRRAYPFDIDWVITPDPDIAEILYYEGLRTMLWTDPRYSRPEFRPDAPPHQPASWASFAGEIRADKDLIAGDERISSP